MLVTFTIGCKDSKSDSHATEKNMNESIQNTFFDTPFGASKEEVIKNFGNHGLHFSQEISNENPLFFCSANSEFFSFGNMSWSCINVFLNNNKFYQIDFYNPKKEKQSAISDYNGILSAISEKYKLTKEEPEDTTTYARSVGYGNNNSRVKVSCYKYETLVSHELWYTASLSYINDSIAEEPSDEL